MKQLIINGHNLGEMKAPGRMNFELNRFSFLMVGGYYVGVDCPNIKSMESAIYGVTITTYDSEE